MRWIVPDRTEQVAGAVREARDAGATLLFTGRADPPEESGPWREDPDITVLSTAGLRRVMQVDAGDLTVTVEAGVRLHSLAARLAGDGAWLPLAGAPDAPTGSAGSGSGGGDGPAVAAGELIPGPGSVGGAVAAAPPGPFDEAFGPVRRHLLACRLVTHAGSEIRWGRGVMKDVAGYDLPRLACGSFGTIGVLLEATFRLWPAPGSVRSLRIEGGSDALSAASERGGTGAPARFRPDALVWRWFPGREPPEGELTVRFLGDDTSVTAREERLRGWCGERGLDAEPVGAGRAPAPRTRTATVVGITFPRGRFVDGVRRVRDALAGRAVALEALPLRAHLRCAYEREPGAGDELGALRELEDAVGEAPIRVERGSAAEIAAARERTSRARRDLEERVLAAVGGRPRHWLSGYL